MTLGIIAVLSIAAAILVNHLTKPGQNSNLVIGPLIGGLDVDQIAKISVKGQDSTATLVRSESRFVVVEKDNYPASVRKVNDLVRQCLDIRTAELRTEDPAFHKDLGVTEEDAATVITLWGADEKPIIGVCISKSQDNGSAYVRLLSENKVYLTLNVPWMSTGPMDYIDKTLLETDSKKIAEVSVTDPNGVVYTLGSDDEGSTIKLTGMPAGKQFKGSDYKNVFTALSNITVEDVIAQKKIEDFKPNWKYVCKLSDSTVYTLQLEKRDSKTYLLLNTEFTDTTPVVKEKDKETEEQLKAKEAKLLARDSAERLAKKAAGWLYTIPEYKASNLMKSKTDLIEDIPAAKPESQPQAEAAAQ